jgi:galactose mutarotase-like enzyme
VTDSNGTIVALNGPGLSADISERGAELVRLRDAEGRDLLWNGDPAFWTGRAPLLFPMVGRAKGDRIRVDGRAYDLPKHGFARSSRFTVVEGSKARCTMRLSSSPATLDLYPFAFDLDVIHAADRASLTTTAIVRNRDERALPVSFGFHPALRWPLPFGASRAAHEIVFHETEDATIRRVEDGLLTPVRHPSPIEGRRLRLRDDLFIDDALIFEALRSRSVTYGAPGSPSIRVDFPDMPHLGIWTKPGAGFICIEPWQGHASPDDFDGEFASRPGVMSIPVGQEATFVMIIALPQ